jgi:hypothetical protein
MKDKDGKRACYAYCDVWRFCDGKMAGLVGILIIFTRSDAQPKSTEICTSFISSESVISKAGSSSASEFSLQRLLTMGLVLMECLQIIPLARLYLAIWPAILR